MNAKKNNLLLTCVATCSIIGCTTTIDSVQEPLTEVQLGLNQLIYSVTVPISQTIGGIAGIENRYNSIHNRIQFYEDKYNARYR